MRISCKKILVRYCLPNFDGAVLGIFIMLAGMFLPSRSLALSLDDFQGQQQLEVKTDSPRAFNVIGSNSVLGKTRTLQSFLLDGDSILITVAQGELSVRGFPVSHGTTALIWDGDKDADSLTPTGLGGVNLSADGSNYLRLLVRSFHFDSSWDEQPVITFRVFTTDSHSKTISLEKKVVLDRSYRDEYLLVPYSEFLTHTTFNEKMFTRVGAVSLSIEAGSTVGFDLVFGAFDTCRQNIDGSGTCRDSPLIVPPSITGVAENSKIKLQNAEGGESIALSSSVSATEKIGETTTTASSRTKTADSSNNKFAVDGRSSSSESKGSIETETEIANDTAAVNPRTYENFERNTALMRSNLVRIDAKNISTLNLLASGDDVLFSVKEGKDAAQVLQSAGVPYDTKSLKSKHDSQRAVTAFSKALKVESDGTYAIAGKRYRTKAEIPAKTLADAAFQEMSAKRRRVYRNFKVKSRLPIDETIKKLRANPDVEYAYPNYFRDASALPGDPRIAEQWALTLLEAPSAWTKTTGNSVAVAVIDTGVDYSHEDLTGAIWINPGEDTNHNGAFDQSDIDGVDNDGNGFTDDIRGYDFVTVDASRVAGGEDFGPADNDPMDVQGHGTHCAGIVGARKGNSVGIAGIAPDSKIMALRAGYKRYDGNGSLQDADIEDAILYAIDNGAKVISMSFGGPAPGAFQDEIALAYEAGIVLVAAAGNNGISTPFFPAALPEVISVGATDSSDKRASFSNYGSWLDVFAPGAGILSTLPGNRYESWSGTSMACPYVAGLSALIISQTSEYTADDVRQVLRNSAKDLGSTGWDSEFGFGRIQAAQALDVQQVCQCTARIDSATAISNGTVAQVIGKATGVSSNGFSRYKIEVSNQQSNLLVFSREYFVAQPQGLLAEFPIGHLIDGAYIIKLTVTDLAGLQATSYKLLSIDNMVISGPDDYALYSPNQQVSIKGSSLFPVTLSWGLGESPTSWSTTGISNSTATGVLGALNLSNIPIGNSASQIITIRASDTIGNAETKLVQLGRTLKGNFPLLIDPTILADSFYYSVGDLDGDTTREIFTVTSAGSYKVIRANGSVMTEGNLYSPTGGRVFTRPVITDVDGNGSNEIVVLKAAYDVAPSILYIAHIQNSVLVKDVEVVIPEISLVTGGCVVEDLNRDGQKEVIISGAGNLNGDSPSWSMNVTVYDRMGVRLSGWPRMTMPGLPPTYGTSVRPGQIFPIPAIGNLDADADLEIVAVTTPYFASTGNYKSSHANVLNVDGSSMPGWPQVIALEDGIQGYFASPVIANFVGDAALEIAFGTPQGVGVYSAGGARIWGKPQPLGTTFTNVVSDLAISNIDGDLHPDLIVTICPEYYCDRRAAIIYSGSGVELSRHDLKGWYHSGILSANLATTNQTQLLAVNDAFPISFWEPNLLIDMWNPLNGLTQQSITFLRHSPFAAPAIYDLEGDGIPEVIAPYRYWNSGSQSIGVWELKETPPGVFNSDWWNFHHDASLTGRYGGQLVPVPNRAPNFSMLPTQSIKAGAPFSLTVSATDPDDDVLTYSASGLPTGATFDATTRVFSWTPPLEGPGSTTVRFSVSDGRLTSTMDVGFLIIGNRAPTFSALPSQSIEAGMPFSLTVSATDPDDDALTYSASGLPVGATFDATTRVFSWTPPLEGAASMTVRFSVSDGKLTSTMDVAFSVFNRPRVVSGRVTPNPVYINQRFEIESIFEDLNGSQDLKTFLWSMDRFQFVIFGTQLQFVGTGSSCIAGSSYTLSNGSARVFCESSRIQTVSPNQVKVTISAVFDSGLAVGTKRLFATGYDGPGGNNMSPSVVISDLSVLADTKPPTISNGLPQGTIGAGATSALLQVDTDEIASCRYTTIPNQSYNFMSGFSSTTGTRHTNQLSNLALGQTHRYFVRCRDSFNNTNNVDYPVTFQTAPAPKPDLLLGSLTVASPAVLDQGGGVYKAVEGSPLVFSGVVRNDGAGNAPATAVRILIDGVQFTTINIAALAAGQAANFTSVPWTAVKGSHTITAEVDWSNLIAEVNDSNNSMTQALTVTTRAPVFSVVAPQTVYATIFMWVKVTVTDPDGDPLTLSMTSAPPGAIFNSYQTFLWTPTSSQVGTHTVRFVATDSPVGAPAATSTMDVNITVLPAKTSAPLAPSNFTVGANTGTKYSSQYQVVLSWRDNSDNEDGFTHEFAKSAGGPFNAVYKLYPNITDSAQAGLTSGQRYYFKVCAFNSYGKSCSSALSFVPGPMPSPSVSPTP